MHHLLKLILIKILLLGPFTAIAQTTPPSETHLRPAAELRLFKRQMNWEHMLEANWHPEDEETFTTFRASTRRLLDNGFTVGPYIAYTFGERHFTDWQSIDGEWQWRDRSDTDDINMGFLIQKRWLISDQLSAELRLNYEHRFNHEMNLARLRPGITWQMNPSWILYPRYEAYLLLDSAPTTLYAHGVYLGSLFIEHAPLLFGPFLRYKRQEWWTSPQFFERTGEKYKTHSEIYSLGISVIYSI